MSFSADKVEQVWQKAHQVLDPNNPGWAKDDCGAWIYKDNYGRRDRLYGWEVHHINPVSKGGTDDLSNLIPLQCDNNIATGDGPLQCVMRADGDKNVRVG